MRLKRGQGLVPPYHWSDSDITPNVKVHCLGKIHHLTLKYHWSEYDITLDVKFLDVDLI